MHSLFSRGIVNAIREAPPRHHLRSTLAASASRHYCANSNNSNDSGTSRAVRKTSDDMFNEENMKEVSRLELERMRVAYGLVKEHAEAISRGINRVDPDGNPLLDSRSFELDRLPELSGEMLTEFRKSVPPDTASNARPVSTYNVWDAIKNQEQHELLDEVVAGSGMEEWEVVDAKTMDGRQLARMQRQSVTSSPPSTTTRHSPVTYMGQVQRKRSRKICPLRDENGKVLVDFRNVAGLTPFLSDNLKLLPRRKTGLSAKSQRRLSKAVNTARTMALLHPEPKFKLTVEEMLEMEKNLP